MTDDDRKHVRRLYRRVFRSIDAANEHIYTLRSKQALDDVNAEVERIVKEKCGPANDK